MLPDFHFTENEKKKKKCWYTFSRNTVCATIIWSINFLTNGLRFVGNLLTLGIMLAHSKYKTSFFSPASQTVVSLHM